MANQSGGSITWDLDVKDTGFSTKLRKASSEAKSFGDTADEVGKKSTKSFASVVKGGAALVGTGLVMNQLKNFTIGAVNAFGDFESNLGLLQAVTNGTNKQMTALSTKAIELGKDITLPGISAADAAIAMTELGRAGLSVKDILGASKAVLQSAKAGNIDFATSANLVSTALLAFKLSGKEAINVADLFAAASNATNAEVQDVGLALQQMAAQASNLRIPLKSTVALIAELANQGIRGSDAGTSLRTFLQRLIPQTKEAAEQMKDLSISMFDANGNFIGIRPAIKELQKGLKGLTEEQRQSALQTIFGQDAIRAASILVREGTTGFDKMAKAISRQGAAADLAAARNRGIKGSMDALKSSFQTIQLSIGEFISKALKPLVDIAGKNLVPVLIGVVAAVTVLAIALVLLALPLLAAAAPFLAIAAVAGIVAGGIAYLQTKFGLFNGVIRVTTAVIKVLAEVFKVVFGVIATVVRVYVAIITTYVNIIRAVITGVINLFRGLGGRILGAIGNFGSLLYNAGRDLITGFINGIKDMFNKVKDTLGNLTQKVTDWKGPASVDRKLLTGSGQMIMRGFIGGLESQYSNVRNSLGAFTNGLGIDSSMNLTPSISGSGGFGGGSTTSNVTVSLNMNGVMARSRSDLREISKDMVRSINEELSAKGVAPIGGGVI